MSSWNYLIRFQATDGLVYFAPLSEPFIADGTTLVGHPSIGSLFEESRGKRVTIEKLLAPVPDPTNEIICIGTNYRKHAEEANLPVPQDPVMWYKPKRALAGSGEILVPAAAHGAFLDFEGELTIVTSKDAKDVSEEDAPNFILGYTIGNDLTARLFQDPKRAGGQFTRAKAFDNFAPLGPYLVSSEIFGDLKGKRICTKINGRVVQDSDIDLINGPAKLVSFLSQGTTLPAGTAIMTGTPSGVGWFQRPQYSLKDGDVVEVEITSIGTLKNKMVFE